MQVQLNSLPCVAINHIEHDERRYKYLSIEKGIELSMFFRPGKIDELYWYMTEYQTYEMNYWNRVVISIYQPSIWSYFYILEMQRSEIASFKVHKRQFKHSILSSHNRMLHSWLFHGFLYIMLLLCHRRWKIASQVDNRYQWNLYGSKLGTQQSQMLLGHMWQ